MTETRDTTDYILLGAFAPFVGLFLVALLPFAVVFYLIGRACAPIADRWSSDGGTVSELRGDPVGLKGQGDD